MSFESQSVHVPVMLNEVMTALSPKSEGVYIDGTFGGGGYSRALLERCDCRVYAIDRDGDAILRGKALMEAYPRSFEIRRGNFCDMDSLYPELVKKVDGIALDIGPSSFQLDEAARGFSFRFDAPLDMRMDASQGETASDVVNTYAKEDLENILYIFGEERHARRIVRKIIDVRAATPITTTFALADLVRNVYPKKFDAIDPATKTFQALRIYVNKELEALTKALEVSLRMLVPQGRLAVVTFHSLEDRIVKNFFKQESGLSVRQVSRHMPLDENKVVNGRIKILTKSAVFPSDEEVKMNRRSRSAKMRVAEMLIKD